MAASYAVLQDAVLVPQELRERLFLHVVPGIYVSEFYGVDDDEDDVADDGENDGEDDAD